MTQLINKAHPLPPHPNGDAATPSRRPVDRQRISLRLDTGVGPSRAVEPIQHEAVVRAPADLAERQTRLEAQILLLKAKTILTHASTSEQKYTTIRTFATQAYNLASKIQDTDLTARCCFYLGEAQMIHVNKSPNYLLKAREYYSRSTLCTELDARESIWSQRRLKELDKMFPNSALSDASNILPWSATSGTSAVMNTDRRHSKTNADTLLQQATGHSKRRKFERVPSFDSLRSGDSRPTTADGEDSASAVQDNGKDSATAAGPLTPPVALQMMLGAYAADFNGKSGPTSSTKRGRAKEVAFSRDTSNREESTGKNISQRRKLSRTLTVPRTPVDDTKDA